MITIAPLPDHHDRSHPLWQHLLHSYRHVITPLRYLGWTTDIELGEGGTCRIRAAIGDGTELVITDEDQLPAHPDDVTGWLAVRHAVQDPVQRTVLYDSTPGGPHSDHTTELIPLFERLDPLAAAQREGHMQIWATYISGHGNAHNQTGPVEWPGAALARYFTWARNLTAEKGYQHVWERPAPDGHPMGFFERIGEITVLRASVLPERAVRPARTGGGASR